MLLRINRMRILVRVVLNWKFVEMISRFCATLSTVGYNTLHALVITLLEGITLHSLKCNKPFFPAQTAEVITLLKII